jgi:hypothetical protein
MRCTNLGETWQDLRCWLDARQVLILPPLAANLPLARLDFDSDGSGEADDVARVVGRLRTLIEHFDVRAVYVNPVYVEKVPNMVHRTDAETELAVVTIRVLAAGAVHELKVFASWYLEFLDPEVSAEVAQLR